MTKNEIEEYINSGALELYCLGGSDAALIHEIDQLCLLHPRIKQELDAIQQAMEQLAQHTAIAPAAGLKNRVLASLDFFDEEKLDIDHLPPTGEYSNYLSWYDAVKHLLPTELHGEFFMHSLQQNDQLAQTLVVINLDVPEETHTDVIESFFILEGRCACTIGNEVFTLNPGDYLEIPLYVNHDIKLLTPYVLGVLQHQFA